MTYEQIANHLTQLYMNTGISVDQISMPFKQYAELANSLVVWVPDGMRYDIRVCVMYGPVTVRVIR